MASRWKRAGATRCQTGSCEKSLVTVLRRGGRFCEKRQSAVTGDRQRNKVGGFCCPVPPRNLRLSLRVRQLQRRFQHVSWHLMNMAGRRCYHLPNESPPLRAVDPVSAPSRPDHGQETQKIWLEGGRGYCPRVRTFIAIKRSIVIVEQARTPRYRRVEAFIKGRGRLSPLPCFPQVISTLRLSTISDYLRVWAGRLPVWAHGVEMQHIFESVRMSLKRP